MAQEGLIKGFNHTDFAKNLATQASELIPKDLSEIDKKFIVDIVYKFCLMSGDALNKDNTINLNANQACLISQFIGEWSFHKSIDLIRGGVDINLREPILQKIAFTIFEIAKQAVLKNMPQEQIIPLVEHHVKKSFEEAINDLVKKEVLPPDSLQKILGQSNIDAMARAQVQDENPHVAMSDAKILKLASLAFFIKNLPKEKAQKIINKFDKAEATVISQYLQMEDLENKLNPSIAAQCLQDMKHHLPTPKNVSYDRCYLELCKLLSKVEIEQVQEIIANERSGIKDFVLSVYNKKPVQMPTLVADTIYEYMKEKIQ